MDASNERARPHTVAFDHPSHPSYFGGSDNSFVARQPHPASTSRFNDVNINFMPEDTSAAIDEYLDASLMAVQYLDLPAQCTGPRQDSYTLSYTPSDSSASSPEASQTTSSCSPPGTYSTQSSPGHLIHDLPDGLETARNHSDFGHYSHRPTYSGGYVQNQVDTRYHDDLFLPPPVSFHDSSMHHRPTNTWGYSTQSLPYISGTSRPTSSGPPTPAALLNGSLGQFPMPDDLRKWPQMFKINQVKRTGSNKKQLMACLFCRERKIGCSRPPEDEPDQTCNQCARRKRKCEYPTESRRGQHTRNRLNAKKILGLEEPHVAVVIPPRLPTT